MFRDHEWQAREWVRDWDYMHQALEAARESEAEEEEKDHLRRAENMRERLKLERIAFARRAAAFGKEVSYRRACLGS